jgi:hypothetical protein
MEFVIVSLTKNGVVECYEAGFDNGCLAMMASVCKFLPSAVSFVVTHIMVIQVTIRPSAKFITTDMLQ